MQYLCKKPSLSGLDRQIFGIFFLWGFISVLVGGIVGGSVLSALSPTIVSQPGERITTLQMPSCQAHGKRSGASLRAAASALIQSPAIGDTVVPTRPLDP